LLAVVNVDGLRVIQFTHFSVKEYLASTRLSKAKDTVSRFHISMTSAHTIVAQACLGVLLHLDENVTKDSLENFPLADYAAKHWVGHARFEGVSSNIQNGMKCLFDPRNRHLSTWVWIYEPHLPHVLSERLECPSRVDATPLHYAAGYGIHEVIKFLILERSQDVNARGFYRETPLGVACLNGHSQVARVLLECDADTESRDGAGWSPFECASWEGHADTVRVLLDYGVDVKAQRVNENAPLHFTTLHRQTAITRMLLERGANANVRNWEGQTPLHWASKNGYVEGARVLLEHGADADARDDKNHTPLFMASIAEFLDVVRLLIQYNADIHALDDDQGQTTFHPDVMQLLSEHGWEDQGTR
jgi:ankyrin repeat protein